MVDGACYLADEVIIVVGKDRGVYRKRYIKDRGVYPKRYIEHKAVIVDTLSSHQSVSSDAGETLID